MNHILLQLFQKTWRGTRPPSGWTRGLKGARAGRGIPTVIGKSFPASDRCTLGSIWFPSSKKWLSSGLQRSGGWAQDSDSGPKEFWVPVKMKSFRTSAGRPP